MKTVAPLLAAGSTFAASVVLGLILGIALDRWQHTQFWILVMLALGFFAGIYGAYRLVASALAP